MRPLLAADGLDAAFTRQGHRDASRHHAMPSRHLLSWSRATAVQRRETDADAFISLYYHLSEACVRHAPHDAMRRYDYADR